MFLLILGSEKTPSGSVRVFTFHNVSINTEPEAESVLLWSSLHSTMFLLIRRIWTESQKLEYSLHSTMFLLIQCQG